MYFEKKAAFEIDWTITLAELCEILKDQMPIPVEVIKAANENTGLWTPALYQAMEKTTHDLQEYSANGHEDEVRKCGLYVGKTSDEASLVFALIIPEDVVGGAVEETIVDDFDEVLHETIMKHFLAWYRDLC